MTRTFYAIDRSPETVNRRGHPEITAFHSQEARNGFVSADMGHRQRLTAKSAETLCAGLYGTPLAAALAKGLV